MQVKLNFKLNGIFKEFMEDESATQEPKSSVYYHGYSFNPELAIEALNMVLANTPLVVEKHEEGYKTNIAMLLTVAKICYDFLNGTSFIYQNKASKD